MGVRTGGGPGTGRAGRGAPGGAASGIIPTSTGMWGKRRRIKRRFLVKMRPLWVLTLSGGTVQCRPPPHRCPRPSYKGFESRRTSPSLSQATPSHACCRYSQNRPGGMQQLPPFPQHSSATLVRTPCGVLATCPEWDGQKVFVLEIDCLAEMGYSDTGGVPAPTVLHPMMTSPMMPQSTFSWTLP